MTRPTPREDPKHRGQACQGQDGSRFENRSSNPRRMSFTYIFGQKMYPSIVTDGPRVPHPTVPGILASPLASPKNHQKIESGRGQNCVMIPSRLLFIQFNVLGF